MACWQDEQFITCTDTFPSGTILSVVDFAENYTLQIQNEIQSQYYHSNQVSIMVHIVQVHRVLPKDRTPRAATHTNRS